MHLLCIILSTYACTYILYTYTHTHAYTQAAAAALEMRRKEIERDAAIQARDDLRLTASSASKLLEQRNILEASKPDEPLAILEDGCRLCGLSLSVTPHTVPANTSSALFDREGGQEVMIKKQEEGRSVVWCHTCGNWYHKACTGITYSPYVLINEGDTGFSCQFCLDDRAASPGFSTHLGAGPQSLTIITQVD